MPGLTDKMRAEIEAIQGNINHSRRASSATKYLKKTENGYTWDDAPNGGVARNNSMFPYKSTAMAVDPSEVPEVQERLRKEGLFVEFDREGRPEITSTKQQSDLAKALGMKTGRDGYGHTDEFGNFHNSGRRRNDEIQEGRGRVRKAIEELESMPEEVPAGAVESVLNEYDIRPTEENTG